MNEKNDKRYEFSFSSSMRGSMAAPLTLCLFFILSVYIKKKTNDMKFMFHLIRLFFSLKKHEE